MPGQALRSSMGPYLPNRRANVGLLETSYSITGKVRPSPADPRVSRIPPVAPTFAGVVNSRAFGEQQLMPLVHPGFTVPPLVFRFKRRPQGRSAHK
ncbi:hypothetical protein GCM10022267_89140 [Lentzea roselyniae]|uniref:Uncharacterized protein n=1 Tax=Lentzea roselyniae TaxID=531940 RepID=A0ABP7CDY0_9PSEU